MKIFSLNQIRQADEFTIERQNISSEQLMERAGKKAFDWIQSQLGDSKVGIHIFCGVGNNGGDGLVIARYLVQSGYNVTIHVVNFSDQRSEDFLTNFDRIKEIDIWPHLLSENSELPEISGRDIVIDAIFGIGFNRPSSHWVATLITHINQSKAFVLSIDIPSGVFMEKATKKGAAIYADYTLSFQFPKIIFFLPSTGGYTKYWQVLDIGLDPEFIQKQKPLGEYIDKFQALQRYRPRDKYSHKGTFGHALMIGGSYGKIGAILMSSEATLHAGAGLVSVFTPKCGYQVIQSSLPEAMVITDSHQEHIQHIHYIVDPTVIGIGPGMGMHPNTVAAFTSFLKQNDKPLVIDADGLNILAETPELLEYIKGNAILTPHPKELERLIGSWSDDFEKLDKMKAFSNKYQLIILVKGAHTITVFQDQMYVNATGNPGMATAGSGDVLTGLISGLVAQGYPLLDATVLGVYIHGSAGDLAVERSGVEALTATDIIDFTGDAFLELIRVNEPKASSTNQNQ